MKFASAAAPLPKVEDQFQPLLDRLKDQLEGREAHWVQFHAAFLEDDLPWMVERLADAFPGAALLGCSACGVIGAGREIENQPAASVLAGNLPDVEIHPFRMDQAQLEAASSPAAWESLLGVAPEGKPIFVALADPFQFHVMLFVERLNDVYPGAPLFGGIASAARQPGGNTLVLERALHHDGLVGLALTGNVAARSVVSQGCRPIGKSYVVTKSQGQVIQELGGRPPLQRLQQLIQELSPEEERLVRQSLFLGRVIDEYKEKFERGDFLIQSLMGVEQSTGALAVAGIPKVGSTVQFHVRDARSADEDLRQLLTPHARSTTAAALLFSCNGRGSNMWPDQDDHDAAVLRDMVGDPPAAGFFCAGEFGPIGGKNFIHGYTAGVALLGPARDA